MKTGNSPPRRSNTGRLLIDGTIYTTSEATKKSTGCGQRGYDAELSCPRSLFHLVDDEYFHRISSVDFQSDCPCRRSDDAWGFSGVPLFRISSVTYALMSRK